MEILLSIIVPVYNVEKYLDKCITSILNQSFTNFEVILIDDCSTDNSREICKKYEKIDSRVKVIYSEKNLGQSEARNKGLDLAKGKYIGFVDSDDSIHQNMYKDLIFEMEKGYDLVVCGREVKDENKVVSKMKVKDESFDFKIDKSKKYSYLCQEFLFPHTVVVYNKIYSAKVIKKLNLRFQDLKKIGTEDTLFNYIYILNINSIKSISKEYYTQLAREGSTMRKYNPGYLERFSNLITEIANYDKGKKLDVVKIIICIYFLQRYIKYLKNYSSLKDYQNNLKTELEFLNKNENFKKIVRQIIFRNFYTKELKKKGYTFKGIIFIKVLYLSIYLKIDKLIFKLL
ncbi:glycosyltransferase family 2 protein [Cetobacterium sp.]|uniref:glycosyltransferase family 2 protein n=1 Tax=Cetobacterium sp. TaxID=2071632 RepID=UPI003F29FDE6